MGKGRNSNSTGVKPDGTKQVETQPESKQVETQVEGPPREPATIETMGDGPPQEFVEEVTSRLREAYNADLASIRERIESLEREVASGRSGRPAVRGEGQPREIGTLYPPALRVRTRDPRRSQHFSGAVRFGREWKTIETARLKVSALDAITNDPLLEVEEVED